MNNCCAQPCVDIFDILSPTRERATHELINLCFIYLKSCFKNNNHHSSEYLLEGNPSLQQTCSLCEVKIGQIRSDIRSLSRVSGQYQLRY